MLGIDLQGVALSGVVLQGVAHRVQGAVAGALHRGFPAVAEEGDNGLYAIVRGGEVHVGDSQGAADIEIAVHENGQHVLRFQLPVVVVGDSLALVAQVLPHLRRQDVAVGLLQQIPDAALAALGVDPDHVGIVGAVDVPGIHGKVGHRPLVEILFLTPGHALGNGVLVGAGEGGEYQRARVGAALVDVHPGAILVGLADGGHVGEVQHRIHPVGVHVHGQGDDVHVSGAFAVAKEGALHPVGARQQGQLRVRHAGAPVVVGMQGQRHVLPVF